MPGDQLRPLAADERPTWAAVRARRVSQTPWLAGALFRAVPVVREGHPDSPLASSDRWGRVYLDPAAESTAGIAKLADSVRAAVLDWVSAQSPEQDWHAPRLDERFPAVGAAHASHAGRNIAHAIIGDRPDAWAMDRAQGKQWRDWATRTAGPPQVPWRDELGGHVRAALSTSAGWHTRTFSRPGRRQLPGIVVPASRGPQLRIGVIADISGSLAPDLPSVVAEVGRIADTAGLSSGSVTLLAVDDEVAAVHQPPPADLVLEPRDGHFTDMRAGFEHFANQPHQPDIIIVLTDAITAWPTEAPRAQSIVVVIGDGTVVDDAAANVPTWARTLRISTLQE